MRKYWYILTLLFLISCSSGQEYAAEAIEEELTDAEAPAEATEAEERNDALEPTPTDLHSEYALPLEMIQSDLKESLELKELFASSDPRFVSELSMERLLPDGCEPDINSLKIKEAIIGNGAGFGLVLEDANKQWEYGYYFKHETNDESIGFILTERNVLKINPKTSGQSPSK